MAVQFKDYDAVLLDLDGTLLRQEEAIPHARRLIEHLLAHQPRFAVISNSTSGPRRVDALLRAAGLPVPAGQVWTAAQAACDYAVAKYRGLKKRMPRVMNLATADVDEMLAGRAEMVEAFGPCDAVIVGTPTNARASEARQRLALLLLRDGAELIGVCADRLFPSRQGLEFGSGAFSTMLGYAAGVRPTFCGKPEKRFFLEVCRRMKVAPNRCLLIGDNLESDVMGAKGVDMRTILVLGGVTRQLEVDALPDAMRPDYVAENLGALL